MRMRRRKQNYYWTKYNLVTFSRFVNIRDKVIQYSDFIIAFSQRDGNDAVNQLRMNVTL